MNRLLRSLMLLILLVLLPVTAIAQIRAAPERKDYKELQPQLTTPSVPPVDVTTAFTGTGLNNARPGGAFTLNDVHTFTVVIDAVNVAASISSAVFTGSGLDDATSGGTYTGVDDHVYTVQICGTGTPDSYRFKTDSGPYGSCGSITAGPITLASGVTIT